MSDRATSRREFFRDLFSPWQAAAASSAPEPMVAAAAAPSALVAEPATAGSVVAIVQGRFCLAYQQSFCSTCVERCPVPGAIVSEAGRPRVDPAICTGCRLCHEVCPAPRNAILLHPRRPLPPARRA